MIQQSVITVQSRDVKLVYIKVVGGKPVCKTNTLTNKA